MLLHPHAASLLLRLSLACYDLLVFWLAFAMAHAVHAVSGASPGLFAAQALGVALGQVCLMALAGVYRDEKSFLDVEHSKRTLKGLLFGGTLLALSLHVLDARTLLPLYPHALPLGFVLVFYGHLWLHGRLRVLRRLSGQRILIYGAGELGRQIFSLIGSPRHGLAPMGLVDDDPARHGACFRSSSLFHREVCQVLGSGEDLPELVTSLEIDHVIVAIASLSPQRMQAIVSRCRDCGVETSFVPGLYGYPMQTLHCTMLGDIPLMRFTPRPMRMALLLKRGMDIAGALTLLLLLSPLLLGVALWMRVRQGGPVLFAHQRVGLHGAPFTMYKFRTMHCHADAYAVNPTTHDDCRVTPLGRFLRRTSLDELPQLVNVLKGDMSLVGPRPEMPFIVEGYTPLQRQRLAVKPGITGLWQISVDRAEAIHEHIEYDLYYIRHQSFFLDCTILLETLAFVCRGM